MALNINGTTGISGVDGSVSAPAVTGTDSNTGITFPAADTIKFSTGGVERMAITNSGISGISGGKILQVVSTLKTNVFSTNASSMQDVTGLNVAITPSSASSKVLITVSISVGGEHSAIVGINLLRGSTVVAAGDANVSNHNLVTFGAATNGNSSAGSGKYQSETHSYTFLDSPNTTSATTYKIQVRNVRASFNEYVVINSAYQGGQANDNSTYVINTTSTITAQEVGP